VCWLAQVVERFVAPRRPAHDVLIINASDAVGSIGRSSSPSSRCWRRAGALAHASAADAVHDHEARTGLGLRGWWLATSGGPGPPATPEFLMDDSAQVARVRESLRRGEPQFQPALAAIEADANRALNVAPVSVMDKGVTPPSGNKHDYLSQAPYWWPNPKTPNGRPYIRRDGRRNPEIDRITDHDNLFKLASAVSSLGLAFHLTGAENYAQHAARLVRVWFLDPATRMNTNLRFAQGIPGIAEGRAPGIIESRQLPVIIDAVTLLQGSGAWSAADNQGFKDWMRAYLQWLLDSPNGENAARRG